MAHVHVWTWDDERPGYSKCRECFVRRNEEIDDDPSVNDDPPFGSFPWER